MAFFSRAHISTATDLAKAGTLVVLAWLAPWAWLPLAEQRVEELVKASDWPQLGLFGLSFALALAALGVAPFLRAWPLRLCLAVLFLVSFAVDYVCRHLLGIHLIANMYALIWAERSRPGPLVDYIGYIWPIAAAMLACGFVWMLPPSRRLALGRRAALVPLAALVLAAFTVNRDFAQTDQLPSTVNLFAQHVTLIAGGTNSQLLDGDFGEAKRRDIAYEGKAQPKYRNIVLVIDESVRGDYLSINNPQLDTTPFLAAHLSDYINFGVVTAATNCSGPSRFVMRTGLQAGQIPDLPRDSIQMPTIWQYARAAGLMTAHIDTWKSNRPFSSMMNKEEARFIDVITGIAEQPKPSADDRVADEFLKLLEDPRPKFMIVDKRGTHVPYADNIPHRDFYPLTPEETAFLAGHAEENRANVRDYLDAVRWRVDHFFERLWGAIQRSDTLVIYTSDHGQTMYEQNRPFTHCNVSPLPGEGWVPLMVMGPKDDFTGAIAVAARGSQGRTSHFQIFPTLLQAMGYDAAWVAKTYGPSLSEVATPVAARFYSPFIFGGKFSGWFSAEGAAKPGDPPALAIPAKSP